MTLNCFFFNDLESFRNGAFGFYATLEESLSSNKFYFWFYILLGAIVEYLKKKCISKFLVGL